MLGLLSRREKALLRKFRMGYIARCRPFKYTAKLIPGEGVIGKSERVRTDTLDHMQRLGYLVVKREHSPKGIPGDYVWHSPLNPPKET